MTISEKIIPICALKDNYIWLFFDEKNSNAWIVDPGEVDPVITMLNKHQFKLSGIFITHHHHDHSGGVKELLETWPNIPIYGSYKSPLDFINHPVSEGDEIICSDWTFTAIEIPGHTLDHTAFFGNNHLFSGDTLFSVGCGRIFEGTPQQMYQSLTKLLMLPDTTKIFCGHEYTLANLHFAQLVEPNNSEITQKINAVQALRAQNNPTLPSLLSEEKRLNPFLRCEQPAIIQAVEDYAGKHLRNPVEVFATLREWKNKV